MTYLAVFVSFKMILVYEDMCITELKFTVSVSDLGQHSCFLY